MHRHKNKCAVGMATLDTCPIIYSSSTEICYMIRFDVLKICCNEMNKNLSDIKIDSQGHMEVA